LFWSITENPSIWPFHLMNGPPFDLHEDHDSLEPMKHSPRKKSHFPIISRHRSQQLTFWNTSFCPEGSKELLQCIHMRSHPSQHLSPDRITIIQSNPSHPHFNIPSRIELNLTVLVENWSTTRGQICIIWTPSNSFSLRRPFRHDRWFRPDLLSRIRPSLDSPDLGSWWP
jgi:hypothetical protein